MPGQLDASSRNRDAVETTVFPTGNTQMKSLLGTRNLYRRLIEEISRIAWPLNDYQSHGKKWNWTDHTA